MDYLIIYSQRALKDLTGIIGHIAEEDGQAASSFGTALLDHVDLLGRFPKMGSVVRKRSPVRKLVHSPFVVYYRLKERRRIVEILHVRHGARRKPRL